jgi:hypothetical protein
MEPMQAKRKIGNAPIPVIGMENSGDDEDRLNRIAVSAYFRAEARGYEPGHEVQDWLDAETEMMEKLK